MILRRMLSVLLLVFVVMAIPNVSYAWNIICGISVGLTAMEQDQESAKWDADSRALRGIGSFFMAVSELQRLQFQDSGEPLIPRSLWNEDVHSSDQAIFFLKRSAEEIEQSLAIAQEYGLGDDRGLMLLNQLHERVVSSHDMMVENFLPQLDYLQETAILIGQFVDHGIELSQEHLQNEMLGHSPGGIRYIVHQ